MICGVFATDTNPIVLHNDIQIVKPVSQERQSWQSGRMTHPVQEANTYRNKRGDRAFLLSCCNFKSPIYTP